MPPDMRVTATRITQRIPDAQRKRKPMRLSLGADVHALLAAHPNASRYVEELVLKDQRRLARAQARRKLI